MLKKIYEWMLKFSLDKLANADVYISFAKREFEAIGYDLEEKDGPNRWIQDDIFVLLKLFSTLEHSVSSAPFAIKYFKDLAAFKSLSPLTGKDSEWNKIGDALYQNKRCFHVFKENGQAYDIEGKIFREPDGYCFTSKDSHVNIEFPYTPKREYIDVEGE